MPYFQNYDHDDERDKNTDINQFTGAGGSAGGGAGGGSVTSGAARAQKTNTGSNYHDLDKYLSANQSQNFGNQVTGKLAGEQAQGFSDQKDAANTFNQQIEDANKTPSANDISGAIANPTAANPSVYQGWENQAYAGPSSLANSSVANQFTKSSQDSLANTNLQGGNDSARMTLLDSYFGKNQPSGYSFGQKALDDELVQNTAGYAQNLNSLRTGASNLQAQAQSLNQATQNNATLKAKQVQDSGNAAKAAIGVDKNGQIIYGDGAGAIGNYENQINQNVAKQNAINDALLKQLQYQLSHGDINGLDAAPLQQYGLLQQFGLNSGQNTYGANLSPYITAGAAQTAANTMTADQLAQLRALQAMAGVSPDTLASTTLAHGSPYAVNAAGVTNAITEAQAAAQKKAAAAAAAAAQAAQNAKTAGVTIQPNTTPLPGPQPIGTGGITPVGGFFPTKPINYMKVR